MSAYRPGADPGFQVGGEGALKKMAPSGGRREKCWGISCEKTRFYAKKIIFFPIAKGDATILGVFRVKKSADCDLRCGQKRGSLKAYLCKTGTCMRF